SSDLTSPSRPRSDVGSLAPYRNCIATPPPAPCSKSVSQYTCPSGPYTLPLIGLIRSAGLDIPSPPLYQDGAAGAAPHWAPPPPPPPPLTGVCSPVGLSVTLRTRPPSISAVIRAFITTASNCS